MTIAVKKSTHRVRTIYINLIGVGTSKLLDLTNCYAESTVHIWPGKVRLFSHRISRIVAHSLIILIASAIPALTTTAGFMRYFTGEILGIAIGRSK